ncbi:Tetratricopeptide repeat-containing protein [Abditibacterium utsteinense]|uniref:Tetratricopeptide repeat-containing protein n=2 Tax=Abditibacterium utsteinense TaxID=1960156 RepID=A0A2S8SQH7_9BACT|nr:Tetratricopeptide repeat-containing protein [Abditibacterium utsteinense]
MSNPNEPASEKQITRVDEPDSTKNERESRAERAMSALERGDSHILAGNMRGDDGDFAGALDDYKKAAQLDPNSPARLVKLAEGYAANDLHGKAFELYQRALEQRAQQGGEELTDAYIGLGDLCLTFARSAAAVRSFERAVRSRPKEPFLRWKLSVALATMGLYDKAEAQLLQILEMAPRDAFYHFHLADLYRVMNRDEDSVSHMESAAEMAPRDEYYRLRLGAAHLRAGDPTSAVPHFQKAAQMAPTNASYQTLLLYAFMRDNQEPEIAVDVDQIELGAYDADFVSRIQRLAQPSE